MKGMLKNRRLAKSISDVAWGEFNRQIEYKAAWYGREVLRVGRFEPTSKTSNCCGERIEGLKLHHRDITCPTCGTIWDRDHNAALNILKVAAGYTETLNACGDARKTAPFAAVV